MYPCIALNVAHTHGKKERHRLEEKKRKAWQVTQPRGLNNTYQYIVTEGKTYSCLRAGRKTNKSCIVRRQGRRVQELYSIAALFKQGKKVKKTRK
jgi:hypothetical protein